MDINVERLRALQDNTEDEFTSIMRVDGPANTELQEVLHNKNKERKRKQLEAAADDIINLLEFSDARVKALVKNIRRHRQEIDAMKAALAEINEAVAYGHKTVNWLPLVKAIESRDSFGNSRSNGRKYGPEYTLSDVIAASKKTAKKK